MNITSVGESSGAHGTFQEKEEEEKKAENLYSFWSH